MANEKTYTIEIAGLGTFEFRHRTMRDEMRIGAEYSRLTEGVETPTPWLAGLADAVATIKALATSVPDGWDVDAMDPFDPTSYDRIMRVHSALREKERFFRQGPGARGQDAGPSDGGERGAVVPADVPAGADR